MKANEVRELPLEELKIKLDEAKEEFFNLRFQNATGQLDNFNQLGQVKREIARIETILHERELGIEIEVTGPAAALLVPKRKWRRTAPIEAEAETGAEAGDDDD